MKNRGVGLFNDDITKEELKSFLPEDELQRLSSYKNAETRIIDQQSQDLMIVRGKDIIDDFRHMELQKILSDFYIVQGQCERIKKFPLPRQYGRMSFIFLLPF